MKKEILILFLLILSPVLVSAVDTGTSVGINLIVEEFAPRIWMCNGRAVFDDSVEEGRISRSGQTLFERRNNYAFEGEQIQWKVLVLDKNKIQDIVDVYAIVDDNIEVECSLSGYINIDEQEGNFIDESCNARILEEELKTFNDKTMAYYDCTFTVESPESMHGEAEITIEAIDKSGLSARMDEAEFWFLNPTIALTIDGELNFNNVRPGTYAYSNTLLIGNDAEEDSGVILDMFISGTNFYDSSSSGAKCPNSNSLSLRNLKYYTPKGAYSTLSDPRADSEGYIGINYGDAFDPFSFYTNNEIIQSGPMDGHYWLSNLLSPGAKMPLTFRLNVPEPCTGNFNSGDIYFWGEAV